MPKLIWDAIGTKTYETGVDHGVLYPQKDGKFPKGVAWNGLTSVSENPSGAEDNALYADNMKYLNLKSAEEYGVTIECYTYPDEWSECNGELSISEGVTFGQQRRNTFGLSYRTKVGNDTKLDDYGYKIHLVYNCSASPSDKSYETINDSPDAITFSYEVTTTPIAMDMKAADGTSIRPVSSIVLDSTKMSPESLAAIEEILYGSESEDARLPMPEEIIAMFSQVTPEG